MQYFTIFNQLFQFILVIIFKLVNDKREKIITASRLLRRILPQRNNLFVIFYSMALTVRGGSVCDSSLSRNCKTVIIKLAIP